MRKLFLLLSLLLPFPAMAQYSLYPNCQLQTTTGQAVAGAQVYFLTQPANVSALTPLATVYSNSTGAGGAVTQPLVTNGFGQCSAYLAPGTYTVVYNSQYTGQLVYPDQNVPLLGAGAILSAPLGAQAITQPSSTNFSVNTSSGGQFLYNGNQVLTGASSVIVPNPMTAQTITQPSSSNFAVNTSTGGKFLYNGSELLTASSGGVILTSPSSTQIVTQPVNTSLNVLTTGTGSLRNNGSPLVLLTPPSGQRLTQAGGTSFDVTDFSNIHYADAWCNTPGVFDDTCWNNAIQDIAANGPIGPGTHRYGVVIGGPNTYNLSQTILLPEGVDVNLRGADHNNLFGTILNTIVNNQPAITDSADSASVRDMTIIGNASSTTGVKLGTAATGPFTITSIVSQNLVSGSYRQLAITMAAPNPALELGQLVTIAGNSVSGYNGVYGYVASISGSTVIVNLWTYISTSGTGTGGTISGQAQPAFDTRLTSVWFQGLPAAIACHNVAGLNISESTWDDNVQYGIIGNYPAGDVQCTGITGSDLEFFGEVANIYLAGNAANLSLFGFVNLSNSTYWWSGRAPAGTTNTAFLFQNASDISISGSSRNNLGDVIQLYGVRNVNIGPLVSEGDGHSIVNIPNGSTNVNLHDITVNNPSVNGVYPAVASVPNGCTSCSFQNLQTTTGGTPDFGTSAANYGLLVVSSGSIFGGNSFNAQSVAPYSVTDSTANFAASTAGSTGPTVNHAACIKSSGPPAVIGYCSTVVDSSGACTCN